MLLASTPFCFFSAFSLATVAVTKINSKIDYFSLYNQNSLMENTDFIWVASSCCPQEGSRCWVEGQVLLEKLLLPIPSMSLLCQGWLWLSALHSRAGELQHPLVSLPESCSHGRALGNLVRLLPSSGALGQQSWRQGAYTMCLQWLRGAVTQLLEKHQGCEPWGAQFGLG